MTLTEKKSDFRFSILLIPHPFLPFMQLIQNARNGFSTRNFQLNVYLNWIPELLRNIDKQKTLLVVFISGRIVTVLY